jgi:hypothetical protein
MKLPDTMLIGGIDAVEWYIVARNSHDGTSAFRLLISPVRVVCANTQALANPPGAVLVLHPAHLRCPRLHRPGPGSPRVDVQIR